MTLLDNITLARRARRTLPSAIREILKVTERPEVISFAGGLPAPEVFPVEELRQAFERLLSQHGAAAMQYGPTEGYGPLREQIAARLSRFGRPVSADEVVVTNGSQQALDLTGRVLVDAGDPVLVESPSYLAALQVFTSLEAKLFTVEADADGVIPGALEEALRRVKPKVLYLNPDFQNPSGARLSLERRYQVLEICARHRVPILEDDPYGELSYDGPRLPPLYALDREGLVIHMSTFSKTLAPGLRLGWVVAPRGFLRAIEVAKQAADLQTGTLAQRAASTLLDTFDYEGHLERIRGIYGARARAMQGALREHFPAGAEFSAPKGGLFLWVKLEEGLAIDAVFQQALEAKVAFVPGYPFFVNPPRAAFMRLNYSHRPEDVIREVVKRLGQVVASMQST